jgi:hypothetical protein
MDKVQDPRNLKTTAVMWHWFFWGCELSCIVPSCIYFGLTASSGFVDCTSYNFVNSKFLVKPLDIYFTYVFCNIFLPCDTVMHVWSSHCTVSHHCAQDVNSEGLFISLFENKLILWGIMHYYLWSLMCSLVAAVSSRIFWITSSMKKLYDGTATWHECGCRCDCISNWI